MTGSYEERVESNKTVEEAMRRKGFLLFTFEHNAHKIDITKKEYEEIRIVVDNECAGKFVFDLNDISEHTGDFESLLNSYINFDGWTTIKYLNTFKFEKFVGPELEEKEMNEYTEVEEYHTIEELKSIYYRVMN